jgi:hypothetical protein
MRKVMVIDPGLGIFTKSRVLDQKDKIPDAKKGAEVCLKMPLLKRMMDPV